MNEAETRAELIDPALSLVGWGKVDGSRVRREVIAPGRLLGGKKRSQSDIADYVLVYRGQKLAVIEAKKVSLPDTEGLAQAKRYATKLQARFAYSTNGKGIYRVDMQTGAEGYVETYASPDELWQETFADRDPATQTWREHFAEIPFEDKGGSWEARYYQHNAINQALEAIASGDYPADFFDFVVIDECHRGGANDESNWRGILEYFSPAIQLGLTATPKRKGNVDTYAYFGEPVYIYSLKEGINDGYLTPFRVRQFATTMDDYTYTADDAVIKGEVEEGERYTEDDFNRLIIIAEREAYRVKTFMELIDQNQKTLVFCATQKHALMVRDLINL